jgi:hypothetical protein
MVQKDYSEKPGVATTKTARFHGRFVTGADSAYDPYSWTTAAPLPLPEVPVLW